MEGTLKLHADYFPNPFLSLPCPSPPQSLGLVAIHLHSHGGFLTKVTGISFGSEFPEGETRDWALGNKMELVPFHQFLWLKLLHLTLGQVRTAVVLVRCTAVYSSVRGGLSGHCTLKYVACVCFAVLFRSAYKWFTLCPMRLLQLAGQN